MTFRQRQTGLANVVSWLSLHKQFPKISMYGEEVGVKVSAADLFISFHQY